MCVKTLKIFEKVAPLLKLTATEKLIEIVKIIQPDLVNVLEIQKHSLLQAR